MVWLWGIQKAWCSDLLETHYTTNAQYFFRVWGQSKQSVGVSSHSLCVGCLMSWVAKPCTFLWHWVGPVLHHIGLWALSHHSVHIHACCHTCGVSTWCHAPNTLSYSARHRLQPHLPLHIPLCHLHLALLVCHWWQTKQEDWACPRW